MNLKISQAFALNVETILFSQILFDVLRMDRQATKLLLACFAWSLLLILSSRRAAWPLAADSAAPAKNYEPFGICDV